MPIPPPPGYNNRKDPRLKPEPAPDPFTPIDTDQLNDSEITWYLEKYLGPDVLRKEPSTCRYIVEYFKCRNNSQACRAAGIPVSRGAKHLRTPEVYECIKQMTGKQLMKYGYDEHEVMARVKEIGEFDPLELVNPDGTFKTSLAEISPEGRRAIKKFEAKNIYQTDPNGMPVFKGVLLKVELWDKLRALEQLGVEKQLFKKTVVNEHTVSAEMASILLESGNRADQRRVEAAREVVPQLEGRVDGGQESESGPADTLAQSRPVPGAPGV